MEDLIDRLEPEKKNFIPCLKWVKRGVAKENPETVQLTKEELEQVIKDAKSKLSTAEESEGQSSSDNLTESNPAQDNYNFDKYDEEDGQTISIDTAVTVGDEEEVAYDDSDSEKEDDLIKSSDNLVLVGHVEGDASILEVYIYNESEGSLYVHHDFILPSVPLCLEWLDYEPGQTTRGNLCAVGTLSPVIEVWDLDIVNCLESAFQLGRLGNRRKHIKPMGHRDAVLDIAWNKNYHHIIASASVDQTVLLWDLDQGTPHTKLTSFEEKVQCVKWHSQEAETLLTGSCDKMARVFDCRSKDSFKKWNLDGEAERVTWDPMEPSCFLVGTSVGSVQCFDCRKGMLWSLENAHEQEISGLTLSDKCKGLLLTSSGDGSVKTWDYSYNNIPELVHTKEMKLGLIHCMEVSPDSPFVIANGGDNKSHNFSVIDLRSNDPVNHRFGSRPITQPVSSNDSDMNTEQMECLSINQN